MGIMRKFELRHNSGLALVANVLWVIFGPGFLMALLYVFFSISLFVTIIGIPFGWEILKIARLALWPFGYKVKTKETSSKAVGLVMNVIWIIFGGFLLTILHFFLALFWFVTIIGIPFGVQHLKLAYLSLVPFGKKISPARHKHRERVPPV